MSEYIKTNLYSSPNFPNNTPDKSLDEIIEHYEKLKKENKSLKSYINSLVRLKDKQSKELDKLYEYKQKEEDREEFFKVYASLSTEDRKFTRSFIRSLSDRRIF